MRHSWPDRLTAPIVPERSRLWTVFDADGLFLEPAVTEVLAARGYAIVQLGNPFDFRYDYETRFRNSPTAQWIVHISGEDEGAVPFDVLSAGRVLHVRVAELFDNLDPNTVRAIGTDHYDALDAAYSFQVRSTLSPDATKDFISANLFRFSPTAVRNGADFWAARFDLFFDGVRLPRILATRAVSVMVIPPDLGLDAAVDMLVDDALFVARVQHDWDAFVAASVTSESLDPHLIPFSVTRIRRSLDTMVLDGVVRPATAIDLDRRLPAWAGPMVADDVAARERLLDRRIAQATTDLPSDSADHRAWLAYARRHASIVADYHGMDHAGRARLSAKLATLRQAGDERLRSWTMLRYDGLASMSAARAPAMVHQIPRHLEHRRASTHDRTALIVMDGLALDQWLLLERDLASSIPSALVDASAVFAWLPTLTSISRQSIFAGAVPRTFAGTISNTSAEPRLWRRFWTSAGIPDTAIVYAKSIASRASVDDLINEELTRLPPIVGIVVDVVDRMMHGTVLGKANLAAQIEHWITSRAWAVLVQWLLDNRYEVFVTADHGNVDAIGQGRPQQGVAALERGERVRLYDSAPLRDVFLNSWPSAFAADFAGLPPEALPAFASSGEAFASSGEHLVTHGGLSMEELIVPFVRISRKETA